MSEPTKRSGAEWCSLTGVIVLDPDGWDRRNFTESWEERIDYAEFRRRWSMSTIDARHSLPEYDPTEGMA